MESREERRDPPPPPGMAPFVLLILAAAGLIGWGAYGQWQRDVEATRTLDKIRTLVNEHSTCAHCGGAAGLFCKHTNDDGSLSTTSYCSSDCQKADWPSHKAQCDSASIGSICTGLAS